MFIMLELILFCCLTVCLEYAEGVQTNRFWKISGVQLKVFKTSASISSMACSLPCHLDKTCAGYDHNNGVCSMYKDEADLTMPPRTIMLKKPVDCAMTTFTGVYSFIFRDGTPYQAYCHEGWTYLMRRTDGSIDFYLYWNDYKHGFGDLTRNFWIGNDIIHKLTNEKQYKLRLEFTYWDTRQSYHAEYQEFKVDNEKNKYRLTFTGYQGPGDINSNWNNPFGVHNNMYFSTRDRDNDHNTDASCAHRRKGAFWYWNCAYTNPTGLYKADLGTDPNIDCMFWYGHGSYNCLSQYVIKIKPQ